MKTAVIDLGSSFIKLAVLDMDNGCVLEEEKRPSPPRILYEDKLLFEVPAKDYADIVKASLDRWSRTYHDLTSLLFSTQMHGFIYVPEKTKDAIYVSWQDMRCMHKKEGEESYLSWMQKQFTRKDMEHCGVSIKPSLGLCNLYTMLDEDSSISREGTLYTLGSYVIEQLTGNNICHISNAAPWGLVDVAHRRWSEELLHKAQLDCIKLPKLAESDVTSCGRHTVNGCTIEVYPDYGDQQIAVLGCMPEEQEGLINIATASQVSRISEDFHTGNYEIRPYFEGKFLNTISNMPSGRGLDVLVRFVNESTELLTGQNPGIGGFWNQLEKQFVYDTRGIRVDMSFYAAPSKFDGGEIRGITQHNFNLNSLFSAAFYDMAQTYGENLEVLFRNHPMKRAVCSGGVSWKRPELIRVISEVLGFPCRLSVLDDEVLAGLYRMALCCNGICKNLDDHKELLLSHRGEL